MTLITFRKSITSINIAIYLTDYSLSEFETKKFIQTYSTQFYKNLEVLIVALKALFRPNWIEFIL